MSSAGDPWAVASDAPPAANDPWGTDQGGWSPSEDQAREAVQTIAPGATITSQGRSADHNAAIGGVPDSMHLYDQAADIVLPKGLTGAQFKKNLQDQGYPITEFLDEGTHIHWGWGPKNGKASTVASDPWAPAGPPNDGHWHNTPQENADLDAFEAAQKALPADKTGPSATWWDTVKSAVTSTPARWKQMAGAALQAIGEHPEAFAPSNPLLSEQENEEINAGMAPARAASGQKMAQVGAQMYAGAAADIKSNMPNLDASTAKRLAYTITSGTIDLLPILAATAVTKNPVVGGALIGAQSAAPKYGEARADGRTPDQAAMDASFTGLVNGALGALPLGALMKPGQTFLAKTLQGAATFGAVSVATEALQLGYDKGLVNPNMTLSQAMQRLEEAGIVGTLQGAFLGGGHAGLESAVNRLHAATPAPPARVEPAPASTAPQKPEPAPAPAQAKQGSIHADVRSALGLETPGKAPAVDPWAPDEGYRTNPGAIAAEHAAEVSQIEAQGTQDAARNTAAAVDGPGIARRALESDVAVTSSGREVPVQYAIVEASHLVPSQTHEGNPNPAFPAELQPRDRTRAVSQAQVASIAQNINPRLLDRSVNASDGAPIVAQSGVVESGNGRSLAIQRAYAENLPSAQAYRDYLAQRGYPVDGMEQPVLVRIRTDSMSPVDRQAFVREANQAGQLGYSATERAMSDAAAMPDHALDLFRSGDVEGAGNREFVRAFMAHTPPANEHAAMVDPNGNLSLDGARRVRAALLAKAYADPDLVGNVVENSDSSIKAIGNALTDTAADWAKMRAGIARGEIPASLDQTSKLLEAVQLVARARRDGRNVAEFVGQPDIFTGQSIDPDTEAWLRLMFRNTKDWTQPVGRDKLAEALRFYAREAQKAQVGANLLGEQPVSAGEVLSAAKARQYGEQSSGTGPSLSFGEDLRARRFEGDRSGFESPEAGRGAQTAQPGAEADLTAPFGRHPTDVNLKAPISDRLTELGPEAQNYVAQAGIDSKAEPVQAIGALANWVYQRGRRFGFESMAARDTAGKIYGSTNGDPGTVTMPGDLIARMENRDERVVSIHNHPTNSSFSGGDLATLARPGHAAMVLANHDGEWHAMTLKAKPVAESMNAVARALKRVHLTAREMATAYIDKLYNERKASGNEAHYLQSQMTMQALVRAGVIDYMGPDRVPERLAKDADHVVNKAAAAIRLYLNQDGSLRPAERSAADTDRRPQPVRLADGIAQILGEPRQDGAASGSEGSAGRGAGQSEIPGTPEQLKLLEDERRLPEKSGEPLTEAQFYRQYVQHVDLRGRQSGKALETRDAVLRDGFKKGANVNAMPPTRAGEDNRYAPKEGDVVYLAPKGAWKDAPNGPEIQDGWKPAPYEAIQITDPSKSMYKNYLEAFKRHRANDLSEEKNRYEADRRRYAEEPGAADAQGRPLPQSIIPGAEPSAVQLAKARDGRMGSKAEQKPPGGLFGAQGVPGDEQLSLFEERRRYEDERLGAVSPDGKSTQDLLRESTDKNAILDHIAKYSTNPERRDLARVLKVTIADNTSYRPMRDSEVRNPETGHYRSGFYARDRRVFTVHPDIAEDPERTFLHEAVHAATVSAIDRNTPAGKAINRLFDAYQQLAGKYSWRTSGDQYGFYNSREFIAEALTKPKFRAILDTIKADGHLEKSLLQKLNDILRRLFRLKPSDPLGYIYQNEPSVFDPKTILGGAAHETLTIGEGKGRRPYVPEFAQDDSRSLFEDGRRYGEIPRDEREVLEKAARTGDWIGKYAAEGGTPDARIRNAIAGAFQAWRRSAGSVPAAVRTIFGRLGGGGGRGNGGGNDGDLPDGFRDVPTGRPTELFSQKVKQVADAAMDLVHDAQMLVAPMAEGTPVSRATAKDFANLMRLARWHGNRMMEGLKKSFTPEQRRKMWEAADEESVLRQNGEATAGRGLSTLTPEERRAVLEQQADAQNVWQAAKDQNMVQGEGLPSYVPRMMVEMARGGAQRLGSGEREVRSIPGIGRNLKTQTGQMKHRKYLTTEETEAAGSKKFAAAAQVVRDIQTLPLATMKLREAVAGRALINKIKEIGQKTGDDTVVEGHEPAGTPHKWFTLDNPAFKTWRPKLIKNEESGKYEPAKDQNGDIIFEKVPLFVRGDFEGPLRSVLSLDSGKIYNGLMNMKGRAMTAIMYSPLIHNAVEWGRALPAMPGKVATFRIYFEGNRAKRDPETMTQAILHGLVPIGHQAGMQDITSIANVDSIKAGRSWTAKIVGAVPGLFSRDAQQAVYRTIDKMGDLWHNTLLWDRVGDLQMGLYTNFRDHLIAKGNSPDAAAYMAAHFANRYAGALPLESMSTMARKIANLTLFSRTYTLGNLGAMKDVITGLPRDVQAQIARDGTLEQLKGVRSLAARKAIAILATDIALFYAGNSILQSAVSAISGRQDLNQIEQGYVDRLKDLLGKVTESPLELLNPFADMQALSATSENEPGRQNRILVGYDHNGTAIYARNPVGKIGEEFTNWLTSPLETLKSKFSTILRPTYQVITNDAGFGRQVYDPKAKGLSGLVTNLGHIVSLYLSSQVPLESLKSAGSVLKGSASEIDTYKTLGPLAGVTFSKGAPGGPGVGELFELRRQRDAAQAAALPIAIEKIKKGDIAGARADMRAVGISPGLQNYYVRVTQNPRLRLNTRSARELLRQATPEERARILQSNGDK